MLIPNSTQVPNIFLDLVMPRVSGTEWKILCHIIRKTYGWIADKETGRRKEKDWISYSQLVKATGMFKEALARALRNLEKYNLIQILDEQGNLLKTPQSRRGKKLHYRINTDIDIHTTFFTGEVNGLETSSEIELVDENMFGNRTSEIEHTKETNTKDNINIISGSKKPPSCPLLNGSPLRAKYPNGHKECAEYIQSWQETRRYKFINLAKQYMFLHKILKAGADFPDIDRVVNKVEHKYGQDNWDFATVANWMDKGG